MSDFKFQYNWILFLLGIVPFLILIWLSFVYWRKKQIKKIGDPTLVSQQLRSYSNGNARFKGILALIALALIITAAANLQKPGKNADLKRKGIDVMIALDLSKSMLAADIKPNRLEKARQFIYKMIDAMPNDRIGFVVFAGHSYLQMPLTTDHAAARLYVQNADPDLIPTQGTVISEALKMCYNGFNSKERRYKSIILITDGEDHDAEAVSLIPSLNDAGIMVNTVGIGSPDGAPIVDPLTNTYKTDLAGNQVISKLNTALLEQISKGTKGKFTLLNNVPEAVSEVDAQLNTIEKAPLEDNSFREYNHYFFYFVAAAIFVLLLEFFWPARKWKTA